ncbi:MAG: Hsp20/alpha crystallin family protein [Leptolyngbyaceae cyanobacterium RU_5_1]|nr:Hsp20/alpha crystallin family protein [Leptolyngbyaceae cyanobacterium RU_5_1]
MTLIRWQPWQEIDVLRRQFDELFDELTPISRGISRGAVAKPNGVAWTPAIEIKSTDTDITLRVELPGIEAKNLDVQVSHDTVSIAGEYKSETRTEDQQIFRSEFRYGSFQRVISLPTPVQNDQVNAEFKDGILTLTMPKVEAERPKVVKVNLG